MGIKIDINNGGVRLAKSNDLRFVRTDSRSGYFQNKDDYLLSELVYPNINTEFQYYQKFKVNDSILTQIATIYDIDSVKLYNSAGVEVSDLTSDVNLVRGPIDTDDYGEVNFYNHEVDTAALSGVYYLEINIDVSSSAAIQTYKSELFEVKNMTAEDGVYIEYYNDQTSKYDDGIWYNGLMTFKMWVDGRIYRPQPGEEKTVFNSFNYQPEILKGQPIRADLLQYGPVAWYISEKLNLALQHDNLTINGIEYTSDAAISDSTKQGDIVSSIIHEGSVELRPRKYESYVQIIEEEEEVTKNILWGESDTDYIKWDSDTGDRLIYDDE